MLTSCEIRSKKKKWGTIKTNDYTTSYIARVSMNLMGHEFPVVLFVEKAIFPDLLIL